MESPDASQTEKTTGIKGVVVMGTIKKKKKGKRADGLGEGYQWLAGLFLDPLLFTPQPFETVSCGCSGALIDDPTCLSAAGQQEMLNSSVTWSPGPRGGSLQLPGAARGSVAFALIEFY